MGAKRVEAVSDPRHASDQSFGAFQYVVVRDDGEGVPGLPKTGVTLVHVPWVKDCLIAGRLLPPPEW